MIKINYLLFLYSVLVLVAFVGAAEVKEYEEIQKIMKTFDSTNSDAANLFSVYQGDSSPGIESRYQFIKDLDTNKENIQKFGDFPYNPTDKTDETEYKTIESAAIENRNIIIDQFNAIENALKYLKDILERYQYMSPEDKKEQSSTVIKYILGQTVLPEESLPTRLPILSSSDCINWLDSELQLLVYQYDHNDRSDPSDFEKYSKINLTQCLNYITTGYSMVVSAKKANGDADAEEFYQKFSVDTSELIKNHEDSVRKKAARSARKKEEERKKRKENN
ncbi:hypothetical protein PIROE2DRAFT_14388 [Piromyces sp. E2]|nr:hypothetical protein PIROE2DRAFT_14388 [Piromyces sp. E2]|eukprot:OUM59973.1 hypothetical protein PIROE2DRAFT_14388 [Piromyces sp. E2]